MRLVSSNPKENAGKLMLRGSNLIRYLKNWPNLFYKASENLFEVHVGTFFASEKWKLAVAVQTMERVLALSPNWLTNYDYVFQIKLNFLAFTNFVL